MPFITSLRHLLQTSHLLIILAEMRMSLFSLAVIQKTEFARRDWNRDTACVSVFHISAMYMFLVSTQFADATENSIAKVFNIFLSLPWAAGPMDR